MKSIFDFFLKKEVITPILIVIFAILFSKVTSFMIKKIFTRGKDTFEKKRRTTIIGLVTKVLQFFIYAIAIMMILNIFGVDTNGILASLGIAGVVLGLALQDTAQDLMSGISIILENYYVIGDYIKVNGFEGYVISVSLQSTKVKSTTGEVYIFSNRNMNSVVNLSQADAGVFLEIPTAYEEKCEKVEKALKEVIEQMKKEEMILPKSSYLGINSFASSSINYAIIIYCKSGNQWSVKRETLKRIKEKYEEENIKIPYDQIEVHNGKEV